ncbi:hypothetical protein DFQ27_003200 [Actinomortierella ambigua]|uniref:Endonuclease/exonuclease/phosphatase domain-containing protein n=1 Tax=Actinomortierella ambigua TaxID=1343610 RepID=A0A9P6QMU6_9FUNG|nr:hypothetical protein DFQ27_003200 [Actinomortierella ambigua]
MSTQPRRRMLPLAAPEMFGTVIPEGMKKNSRLLFMSYNILAQALVRRDMFPLASKKALQWKFRRQNLLQEMLNYGPDIACLQEVDFWDETYLPAFSKAGYDAVHYRNAKKKHGCAIIWRRSRFEKVEQRTIEYDDCGQPTFLTGNIGIMVGLKPVSSKAAENPDPNADMVLPEDREEITQKNGGPHDNQQDSSDQGGLVVATTHLFWRPDGSYERLRQASIFMDKLMEFQKSLNYTVLIGGDFNTTPRDAAYRVMTRNDMPHDQIPNLEKWLKSEVSRLNEAGKEQQQEQQQQQSQNGTSASQSDDGVQQVQEKLESSLKLDGGVSSDIAPPVRNPGAGVLYPAPPTGIVLINRSNEEKPKEGGNANGTAAAGSGASKGEDAPVVAPLEAFTSPQDLVKAIHAHPRCLSIYSQYEEIMGQNPQELAPPAKEEKGGDKEGQEEVDKEEKVDDDPYRIKRLDFCHGEPKFTNYATWFKDTLDYVYLLEESDPALYTPSSLRLYPRRLLEIPDHSWLGNGLPDEHFSSDHLCLLVEFYIRT